mmetsp:Transcript_38656/g.58005  ORF Transcript_38656/g.58005 Transcript_38656/m.58005 type:complete len:910 (-) Transcript_38656:175-2904(-)
MLCEKHHSKITLLTVCLIAIFSDVHGLAWSPCSTHQIKNRLSPKWSTFEGELTKRKLALSDDDYAETRTRVGDDEEPDKETITPVNIKITAGQQHLYANYWENLLHQEYEELAQELTIKQKTWSQSKLEQYGYSIFNALATPDSEIYGEKVLRITKEVDNWRHRRSRMKKMSDLYSRGDVLLMSPSVTSYKTSINGFLPRECCVMDAGDNWLTAGVGVSWPKGLFGKRQRKQQQYQYQYMDDSLFVRLDRIAPKIPYSSQIRSLQLLRNGKAGEIADLLVHSQQQVGQKQQTEKYIDKGDVCLRAASEPPSRFKNGAYHVKPFTSSSISNDDENNSQQRQNLEGAIQAALDEAKVNAHPSFKPNLSQEEAILFALSRSLSLIQGPPGTGKTRVAALLISTALRLRGLMDDPLQNENSHDNSSSPSLSPPPRILAVTHSNGAADVLLETLLSIGVPAIRAGRPATINSPKCLSRTVYALAQSHPDVKALREKIRDVTLPSHVRSQTIKDMKDSVIDVQKMILETAPVVVTSCIGAQQLLARHGDAQDDKRGAGSTPTFPLVVLDEAAQTTEPALLCALTSAKAEQIVLVGDTKQLPPTVTSSDPMLRSKLGLSPMSRLESYGIKQKTLNVQYRMPHILMEHPSRYFYDGLVSCPTELPSTPSVTSNEEQNNDDMGNNATPSDKLPSGFPWPLDQPLAFINVQDGLHMEQSHGTDNYDNDDTNAGGKEEGRNQGRGGGTSNPTEAILVADIVQNLILQGDVQSQQIGIIAPYAKQVELIQTELHKRQQKLRQQEAFNFDDEEEKENDIWKRKKSSRMTMMTRIGTVDSYQGQEQDYVILSATRSNANGSLGFLFDPRRLNVAITRSKQGLIIVGDGRSLSHSRHWRALFEFCKDRGCVLDADELRDYYNCT